MIRKPLTATVTCVWSGDPGLDKDRPGFAEAWQDHESTGSVERLPVKDGATLARFTIAPLSMRAVAFIGQCPEDRRLWETVTHGLRAIAELDVEGLGPVELEVVETPRGPRVTDASLERAVWFSLLGELSRRIWEITRIDP